MGLRINNNLAALNSYGNLAATDKALGSSLEKLSSGFRINKAADDAAGLGVSEGLKSQVGGPTVAARNAQEVAPTTITIDQILMAKAIVAATRGSGFEPTAEELRLAQMDPQDLANQSNSTESSSPLPSDPSAPTDNDTAVASSETDRATSPAGASGSTPSGASDETALELRRRALIGPRVVAARNAQDGLNMNQTAEGALNEVTIVVQRMRDLVAQLRVTASDPAARRAAQTEIDQLVNEIDRVAKTTTFDGVRLLDGTFTNQSFLIEVDSAPYDLSIESFTAAALELADLTLLDADGAASDSRAAEAEQQITSALDRIRAQRTRMASSAEVFERARLRNQVAIRNIESLVSADWNAGQEFSHRAKWAILSQAGTSMLAQANISSQSILSLIQATPRRWPGDAGDSGA